MCGIAGAFHRRDPIDLGRLRWMSRLLRHRGPDDEGILLADPASGEVLTLSGPDTPDDVLASDLRFSPGRRERPAVNGARPGAVRHRVGLVHRRLSIIDLSPAGHGPMCDSDGRCWLTYNGEIYNFIELRQELERMGERFVGGSDTEVILGAYRRFGHECLQRMNGMFAFAIWDAERRELFCARDRFGVKPLYYQWDGDTFAFASEPKALVLTQRGRPRPRAEAIRDLLVLDWVDHQGETFFEGLRQLPAGHYLVASDDSFALHRWWTLDPDARAVGTPEDWRREFAELFTDSVRIRLRADVEVGSCLSGGIDSSAVVTTAARLLPRPMHAFTCAYDEGPAFDERRYVRQVAESSHAISHVVVPDGADFWDVFDRLTEAQDEPTAGPGLFSQWKVMELAHRAGLKVLLDGQGADETLAGYFRYLPARLRDHLTDGRLGEFARLLGPVADRVGMPTALAWTLEPWLPRGPVSALRRRFGQGKDRVLAPGLAPLARSFSRPDPPREFRTALARELAFDTQSRLLPSLLRYEDRNSMAFSIETRLPFLDYRLVQFAFTLPDDQRLDGVVTKAILRRSLVDRIPRAVVERRDKMGFETPTDLWLRRHETAELRRRLLGGGPLHDWLDASAVESGLEDFLAERRPIGLQIWRWLSLESWIRRYVAVDPRVTAAPPAFANGRVPAGDGVAPTPVGTRAG
jgi:asparagine synthase (glutamine-hydrolysing)